MIGDRDLTIRREPNSTPWLTDIVWAAAKQLGHRAFLDEPTPVEDDHIPFVKAGVPSLDIIDLDYPPGTPRGDTLDNVSARQPADRRRCGAGGAAGNRSSACSSSYEPRRHEADSDGRQSHGRTSSLRASRRSSGALPVHFGENLGLGQHRRRRLRLREHAIHDRVAARDAVLLQPEHDVRLA